MLSGRIKALSSKLARGSAALLRDSTGGAMIEYAFVGPPFIALLLANFHTALVFLAQSGLDTAAESAARFVATGQAQTYQGTTAQGATYYGMTSDDFRKAICGQMTGVARMLPPFMTCSTAQLFVDVSAPSVASVNAVASSSQLPPTFTYNTSTGAVTNSFSYTAGASGQITVLKLMYLWPVPTGPFGWKMGNQSYGSNRLLVSTVVFKNESYVCASGQSSC